MRKPDRREMILAGTITVLIALLFIGLIREADQKASPIDGNWQEIELNDVNSGEEFTVAELEKPVLLETFAVWCPTCTNQQREIKKFHDQSNVTSVSLNVDSNEDEQQIRRHTEDNGFEWRYAISPPQLTRSLVDQYGTTVANPPSAPVILICENGSRKLPNGVKSVSELQTEVGKGC